MCRWNAMVVFGWAKMTFPEMKDAMVDFCYQAPDESIESVDSQFGIVFSFFWYGTFSYIFKILKDNRSGCFRLKLILDTFGNSDGQTSTSGLEMMRSEARHQRQAGNDGTIVCVVKNSSGFGFK